MTISPEDQGTYRDQDFVFSLGFHLVPVEPTEWMVDAGVYQCPDDTDESHIRKIWSETIKAAPKLSLAVPSGTVLLPYQPTDAMMETAVYWSSHDAMWEDVYSALVDMITIAHNCPGEWAPDDEDIEMIAPEATELATMPAPTAG